MASCLVRLPHRTSTMRLSMGLLLLLAFIISPSSSQSDDLSTICGGAQDCGACISVNPKCAWCTTDTFSDQRCDTVTVLEDNQCENITNPNATQQTTENDDLSQAGADPVDIVQVKPQRMKINVRPREKFTITMHVRQAEDYPVDLYYAMDLSHSMKDDLDNLKDLGSTLAQEMQTITRDFTLGFGSFVDKTVLPYVSTVPEKLIAPCSGCASPHGFHNVLPLTANSSLFAAKINDTVVSGNLDTPEGGFDALMQIAVCESVIGWRENARHLVVFTTDASFHFAGDGKLGGIVEPNDGRCHMSNEMYTWSTLQDYPSIGHLSAKFRENNVIPIFAVTGDQVSLYSSLENYIEGATVGELAVDSKNVVELIKENYNRITSQVKLTSTAPDDVTLEYDAYCLEDEFFEGSNLCDGLKLGDTVRFDIGITAQSCLDNDQGTTSFTIGPVGFNEQLTIELEVTCSCDCESMKEENSTSCSNGNGTLVCGECECNDGRYGSKCECSGNELVESTDDSSCRPDNTSRTCSGRGECICGKCVCDNTGNADEVISGQYCECDNFNCPYSRGLRCGGPDRGTCVCDVATRQPKCQCVADYTGDSCDCPTRTETCRASNGLECNARGTCECGECVCDADSQYQGSTCEKCPTCPSGDCHKYRDCVECQWFHSSRLSDEDCDMCTIDIINVTDVSPWTMDGLECTFSIENNTACTFRFAVFTENETTTVYVEAEEKCVTTNTGLQITPEEIRWIVIGIILGIVLIGMILVLAWRLYTYLEDKREYAQWKKECDKANWDKSDNPIYKSSTTHHHNPMYGK